LYISARAKFLNYLVTISGVFAISLRLNGDPLIRTQRRARFALGTTMATSVHYTEQIPALEGGETSRLMVDVDDETLKELGYRQEFKRKFNFWSLFSLSFSAVGLLPSVAATLGYSLG
jgi:hypothetical protein